VRARAAVAGRPTRREPHDDPDGHAEEHPLADERRGVLARDVLRVGGEVVDTRPTLRSTTAPLTAGHRRPTGEAGGAGAHVRTGTRRLYRAAHASAARTARSARADPPARAGGEPAVRGDLGDVDRGERAERGGH
jgi:hypothetical protein